jgi:hypothetical protein
VRCFGVACTDRLMLPIWQRCWSGKPKSHLDAHSLEHHVLATDCMPWFILELYICLFQMAPQNRSDVIRNREAQRRIGSSEVIWQFLTNLRIMREDSSGSSSADMDCFGTMVVEASQGVQIPKPHQTKPIPNTGIPVIGGPVCLKSGTTSLGGAK